MLDVTTPQNANNAYGEYDFEFEHLCTEVDLMDATCFESTHSNCLHSKGSSKGIRSIDQQVQPSVLTAAKKGHHLSY